MPLRVSLHHDAAHGDQLFDATARPALECPRRRRETNCKALAGGLVLNGTIVVLKSTSDESIQAFSPAFLLREEELQEIYRQGQIKRMEYFGRIMDWHTKLTDKKRTLYHLTVYRWPFVKKLAAARRSK